MGLKDEVPAVGSCRKVLLCRLSFIMSRFLTPPCPLLRITYPLYAEEVTVSLLADMKNDE